MAVDLAQRADNGVAVLAADFAIFVAVMSVETWFAHAVFLVAPLIGQTVPERLRQQ